MFYPYGWPQIATNDCTYTVCTQNDKKRDKMHMQVELSSTYIHSPTPMCRLGLGPTCAHDPGVVEADDELAAVFAGA